MFPASLPHVMTVAAVGNDLKAAYFSNASAALDLAAPGVDILTAMPLQLDEDGKARRLQGGDRHELLRPDGRRRGGVGARRQARTSRPTRSPRSCALSATDIAHQGLGLGHGLRDAQPRRGAAQAPRRRRPA